ncbi:MAG: hypothetical protein U0X91_02995 [Spirosomataceae bacterium]
MKISYLYYPLFQWVNKILIAQTLAVNYVLYCTYKSKGTAEVNHRPYPAFFPHFNRILRI